MSGFDIDTVDAEMRKYYQRRAGEYDEWYLRKGRFARGETDAIWHGEVDDVAAWVSERRAPIPATGVSIPGTRLLGTVLEVACGTGWWTRVLARKNRVVACDFSYEMLHSCRTACGARGLQPPLVQADAYQLPVASHSVDAVFMGFFMSHVFPEKLDALVAEVARVMRPGGEVWIVDSADHELSGAVDHVPHPREPSGGIHERKLNDGSVHNVYKRVFDAESMSVLLQRWGNRLDVHASAEFFVWGRVILR